MSYRDDLIRSQFGSQPIHDARNAVDLAKPKAPPPLSRAFYQIGVDPGQSIDPTAIAAVRQVPQAEGKRPLFQCGLLERLPLNTTYPGVVQHIRRLVAAEPFLGHSEIVLDLTGVGRPVADLFNSEGLYPVKVTITAGEGEHKDERGVYHVSKLLLVSTVQTLLHDGRLQIQKDLPEAAILRAELEDFRAQVTDAGRWTFGARSGAHDDLVLALALACWRASSGHRPMRISDRMLQRAKMPGRAQNH
jgi:hypothetical protein